MVFQLISIGVFLVFYGCYFGKMICQRRKGIQTDQIGKGKTGFVKLVEVTMKIGAVLVLAAELVSVWIGTSPSPAALRAVGAAVSVAGTAVFLVAVWTMRDSWRAFPKPVRPGL